MIGYDDDCIVFTDEKPFSITHTRSRGRSKRGTVAITTLKRTRGKNITLIAAMSPKYGMLHHIIISNRTTTGAVYAQFIHELLKQNIFLYKPMIVLQDNASIHKTDEVKEEYKGQKYKHTYRYIPPYSPQLNPIELVFSQLQSYIHNNKDNINNDKDLITYINKAVESVSVEDCKGYYRHVTRYYTKCIDMKDLI